MRTLAGHSDWVLSVAVSADGKRVVSGSKDKTVKIWDVETGMEVRGGGMRLGGLGVWLDFGSGLGLISTRYVEIVLLNKQPASRTDFRKDLGSVMLLGSRSFGAQVFMVYILGQLSARILWGGGYDGDGGEVEGFGKFWNNLLKMVICTNQPSDSIFYLCKPTLPGVQGCTVFGMSGVWCVFEKGGAGGVLWGWVSICCRGF